MSESSPPSAAMIGVGGAKKDLPSSDVIEN